MLKTFKHRMYPSKAQKQALSEQLEGHRYVYNQCLADRRNIYEKAKTNIPFALQCAYYLPMLKKDSRVQSCNYSSLQQTLRRLEKTYQAFFRRLRTGEKPGFPRFKPRQRFNSFGYGSLGDGCQIKDGKLYLQNIGLLKVKWHRPIEGKIKTLSVLRRNGRWYVCFFAEVEKEILPRTGRSVGLDVGLESFCTDDSGNKIENPRFFRTAEKRLHIAQRRVARRKKGSKRRRKAVQIVAKQHEHIQNQRMDFAHKEARKIVDAFDFIAVEDLQIKNMLRNHKLSKSISDAAWSSFLSVMSFKAESAGRTFVEVAPHGTSQECSRCGKKVRKSLSVRIHKCSCGLKIDRDQNAAINILVRARTERSDVNVSAPMLCVV